MRINGLILAGYALSWVDSGLVWVAEGLQQLGAREVMMAVLWVHRGVSSWTMGLLGAAAAGMAR